MVLLFQALKVILIKFATQEFLEFVFVEAADALAKHTKTPYDDKFVEKAREILGKK